MNLPMERGLRLKLAKPHIDVGLMTGRLEDMLSFWQGPIGLPFKELLPTGAGNHQHRHDMNGSVFKLNHPRDALPKSPHAGYRSLWIARAGMSESQEFVDPDGNRVVLVPPGQDGVEGIALGMVVRNLEAEARFFREALELEAIDEGRFRCGDSIVFAEEDPDAVSDAALQGGGYRYFTIQVFDCRREHARILEAGGVEGFAPRQVGKIAVISMVRDPDGNWIEISQRGSLTGSLSTS